MTLLGRATGLDTTLILVPQAVSETLALDAAFGTEMVRAHVIQAQKNAGKQALNRTIRTDHGHEFQALFHWHVADLNDRDWGQQAGFLQNRLFGRTGGAQQGKKTAH